MVIIKKMEMDIKTSKIKNEKKILKDNLKSLKKNSREEILLFQLDLINSAKWTLLHCLYRLLDESQSKKSLHEDVEFLNIIYRTDESQKLDALSLLIFSYLIFPNLLPRLHRNKLITIKQYRLMAITLFKEEGLKGNVLPAVFVQNYLAHHIKFLLSDLYRNDIEKNTTLTQEVLELLCRQNNAEAQYQLAGFFLDPPTMNTQRALQLYTLASEKKHFLALNKLIELYSEGTLVHKDEIMVFATYEKMANWGYTRGWYEIAHIYLYGYKKNCKRGFEILSKLAFVSPQYQNVMYDLAKCYLHGSGTSIDSHRALLLFFKDKEMKGEGLRNQTAISQLESIIQRVQANTVQAPKTIKEAMDHYHQTLDSSKLSAGRLAFCYQFGMVGKADFKLAIENYQLAVKKQCPHAQWDLFYCYQHFLDRNSFFAAFPSLYSATMLKDMLSWYESYTKSDADANLILAEIYTRGDYVDTNLTKGLYHLTKALELDPQLNCDCYKKDKEELNKIGKIQPQILSFYWKSDETIDFGKDISVIIAEYALNLENELSFQCF